jgi:hypothetical protein
MCNIFNHKGNANQNDSFYLIPVRIAIKKTATNAGEDSGKKKALCTVGGSES